MADDFTAPCEIEGFSRRRKKANDQQTLPQGSNTSDIIVISSDDDDAESKYNVNDSSNQIKLELENNKLNVPMQIFNPIISPTVNDTVSIRHRNIIQKSIFFETERAQSTGLADKTRNYCAKSTTQKFISNGTAAHLHQSKQVSQYHDINGGAQSLHQRVEQSVSFSEDSQSIQRTQITRWSPLPKESVTNIPNVPQSAEQSEPIHDSCISTLVDEFADRFRTDVRHMCSEQPTQRTERKVWSSRQEPKRTIRNATNLTNQTKSILEKSADLICKEAQHHSDHESEGSLLGSESNSSSISDHDLYNFSSKHMMNRSHAKRLANDKSPRSNNKRRRLRGCNSSSSATSSDSYHPSTNGDSDDDDDDLCSTFSQETDQYNDVLQSPQYEPDSGMLNFNSIDNPSINFTLTT